MKIGILGATGMLGHKLVQVIGLNHDVKATCRSLSPALKGYDFFNNVFEGFEANDIKVFEKFIKEERFDVVINCIGIIKQQKSAYDPIPSIEINSLFPHKINKICKEQGTRFIHISTDCVFSGTKGQYIESDEPDATDLYGKSKELGEVTDAALTIRTSIIGHEISSQLSLVNWFLSQKETVNGYQKAIYSGLPTIHLANVILKIINNHPNLYGLYHVASAAINKYDLLCLIAKYYKKNISILPYDQFENDKSLISDKFRNETKILIPSWEDLIFEMQEDFSINSEFYHKMNPNLLVNNLN